MGDIPLDFDTLQPYGCFIGSAAVIVLSDHDTRGRRGAQHDALLQARVLRPVHAVPQRHRQGVGADRASRSGTSTLLADLSQVMRDASICGLGQAAPNPVDCVVKYFPHELADTEHRMNAITRNEARAARRARSSASSSTAATVTAAPSETIIEIAKREGVEIPHLCYKDGLEHGRQLPRLHGRDRRRARARAVVLPRARPPA